MTKDRAFSSRGSLRAATVFGLSAMLNGCLQTAPVVATPDPDPPIVYRCPGGRTLDVTRLRDERAVVVVVDGNSMRLNRDVSYASAERYSNRLQTLTLRNSDATFESQGRTIYGPCSVNDGYSRDGNTRNKQENTD